MRYCQNPNEAIPQMKIITQIGGDGYDAVNAEWFCAELDELDQMGKESINIVINSPGGSVMDGISIFNRILQTKTPVDTENAGIAGSIAGVIFMAGRQRKMMDYAKLMMHPVQGTTDQKLYEEMCDSISTMLSAKAKCSKEEARSMMDATTWLGADECKKQGFATDILSTRKLNNTVEDAEALYNLVNNSFFNPNNTPKMQKVINLLSLEATANEDAIAEAVNKLTLAKNELETKLADAQEALTTAETAKTEAETAKAEAETAKAEAEKAAETASNEAAELKAENLINQYAARVGDAKATFKAMAVKNYAETEAILKQLPLNVAATPIPTETTPNTPVKKTAAGVMLEIQNRLSNLTK
jgi:ATP-dependent protease ClpP protease subunit